MTISESEFRSQSDEALNRLNRALGAAAERYDADVLFQNGVLTVAVEEPAPGKIVISPNAPVRQIWISAQSRSFKLDWSSERSNFVLPSTGETLDMLVGRLAGSLVGADALEL